MPSRPPVDRRRKKNPRARKPEAPKACRFTKANIFEIDYRDLDTLHRHVTGQGKLQPGKKNGVSAFYQRQLKEAVKRARFLALLPYLGD